MDQKGDVKADCTKLLQVSLGVGNINNYITKARGVNTVLYF